MKRDRARPSGFYWVRFEGKEIVAEYTADGIGCSPEGPHWHVPLAEECFLDKEICELLSGQIVREEPFGISDGRNRYRPCPKCGADSGMGLQSINRALAVTCLRCGFAGPRFAGSPSARLDKVVFDAWNDIPRQLDEIERLRVQLAKTRLAYAKYAPCRCHAGADGICDAYGRCARCIALERTEDTASPLVPTEEPKLTDGLQVKPE